MDTEATLSEAREKIDASADAAVLKDVERHYLGRKGVVANLLATIGDLPAEERKSVGQGANRLKQAIQVAVDARAAVLNETRLASE